MKSYVEKLVCKMLKHAKSIIPHTEFSKGKKEGKIEMLEYILKEIRLNK